MFNWRKENPDYDTKRYRKNRNKMIKKASRYYEEHKEERRLYKAEWRKKNIEYTSVQGHYHKIFDRKNPKNKNYKGMPFFDGWNPKKNGSLKIGADWIIANLGKRPTGSTLHVVNHAKGFVPGNLVWTSPRNQSYQQLIKILGRQKQQIERLEKQVKKLKNQKTNQTHSV